MANNDILQYLRKTPHNTNVNVVKGMLGNESGSGAIEMETVFEDDISLTYNKGTYGDWAKYSTNGLEISKGYIKISFDDDILLGGSDSAGHFSCGSQQYSMFSKNYNFFIENIYNNGTGMEELVVQINGYIPSDSDLETYCQTPHHLKIEYFTV